MSEIGHGQDARDPCNDPPRQPKKKWLWLAAGALLLLVMVSTTVIIGIGSWRKASRRQAIVARADQHFAAAMAQIESDKATLNSVSEPKAAARDEIGAAAASIKRLEQSQGKKDYLASLAALTEAIDAIAEFRDNLETRKLTEELNAVRDADIKFISAIESGNSGNYARMKAQAQAALRLYAKGVNNSYREGRKAEARLGIRMAEAGMSGQSESYNAYVDRARKLRARNDANMPGYLREQFEQGVTVDFSPPVISVSSARERVEALLEKAKRLHKKALGGL